MDTDERMRRLRELPRYKSANLKKVRKVYIRAFLANALGLSPKTIGELFSNSWYSSEKVRQFLVKHGYRSPGKGRHGT